MADFDADRPEALARARAAGLGALIAVGYDLPSSRQAVDLAEREPDVFACVAIHPHHAADLTPAALTELEELASRPKVVGIGEIGLDFYRNEAAHLRLVVERLAAPWDAGPDGVAEAAARNTRRAFGVRLREDQG
jgi:Tat protein secretion system quality control protein TatD with DNase activity